MLIGFLLLVACGTKEVPPHLRVEGTVDASVPTEVAPTTLEGAVALLVGSDPLARRPPPLAPGTWAGFPGAEAVEAWARIARSPVATAKDWAEVENRWPGTVAVPLARGARLAALEVAVAARPEGGAVPPLAAQWLGPLTVDNAEDDPTKRAPFDWLAPRDPERAAAAALAIAERRVLVGWLSGPEIPLGPVAASMKPGVYDRLADSPAGALIIARASSSRDDAARVAGTADLAQATFLALDTVAADRDAEQAALRERLEALAPRHGPDPVAALLGSARRQLTADAAEDPAVGLALLTAAAERVHGSCPDQPCSGLDRVATLRAAAAWDPEVAPLAAAWEVVALKKALDRFEVTHDKPTFAQGLVDLADALIGTTGASVELDLLRLSTASPAAWLAVSRAAGGTQATDYEGARDALRQLLVQVCDRALATALPTAAREPVERVRRRAAR